MFRAPFRTPQSLALRRAHSSAIENAYRLYALTNAAWEKSLDFGFVEEEAREAFVLLSISFRRATEIFGLKKKDLPKVAAISKKVGEFENICLSEITNVGAHLQYFKLHLGNSLSRYDISFVNAQSDERGVYFKPADFVNACLTVLPNMTADAFEERTLYLANNPSTGTD